jgi:hypothetical protein
MPAPSLPPHLFEVESLVHHVIQHTVVEGPLHGLSHHEARAEAKDGRGVEGQHASAGFGTRMHTTNENEWTN